MHVVKLYTRKQCVFGVLTFASELYIRLMYMYVGIIYYVRTCTCNVPVLTETRATELQLHWRVRQSEVGIL